MEDKNLYTMAVLIEKRTSEAPDVQKVFTKYGNCIISRLGIHEFGDPDGFISLNLRAHEDYIHEFSNELSAMDGVDVKIMKMK